MPELKRELKALRVLVVDDEENIRFAISMCLEADGHKVVAVGTIEAALLETARQAFDLIFLDVRLGTRSGLDYIQTFLQENPWIRIVVITAYASIETAVEAMKRGASDYLPKPFEPAQLTLLTQKVAERRLLERKMDALQKSLGAMDPEAEFSTSSPIWRESLELAQRIATANSPILIRGESGTGKGRLARAIHEWSSRARGPFASVCFDGQSVDAIENELFGFASEVEGQVGAVAFCHGGTLLLDEIGNLPLRLQPKLLSVIRDKQFEKPHKFVRRPADVRIIATTSMDLGRSVERGDFRSDLLMTLSVTQIDIPPLRQRPEDILLLADRYLAYFSREHHKPITGINRDAGFVLRAHTWPGNTRELRNVIERAVIGCNQEVIGLDLLPPDLMNPNGKSKPLGNGVYQVGDLVPLKVIEEAHIQRVLASTKTIRRAAAVLGVNSSALCRRLKRSRLDEQNDQPPQ